jgi:aryl-alcohol dehydrogenase-like predicted oxidoreductase
MATGHGEAHAIRIVEHAIELGINFIDTARAYGTERAVGKAIRGKRDRVVLSTKSIVGRGAEGLLTADELNASLEKSLERLGTDYVDIFHLHGVTADQYRHCVESLVPVMERARRAGKIRFLGITETFARDTSHRMLQLALPDDYFDVIMVGYSILNPSAQRTVFPKTLEKDVGTLIMFAVRRALSRPDALSELLGTLEGTFDHDPASVLEYVATHPEIASLVQAAYRFCRHQPGAHVILTGTGNARHLEDNVASICAPPLPANVLERLDATFGLVDSVSGN